MPAFIISPLQYLFDPTPTGDFSFKWILLAISILGVAGAIGLKIYLKKVNNDKILKKILRKLPSRLQNLSISLILYLLFRSIGIPFLSMRIVLFVIFGIGVYVLFETIFSYIKKYPEEKKRHLQQQELNKYIPRKKKK